MYKPKLKKLFVFGQYMGWIAVQGGHYACAQTPEQAYDKLKITYDYYHQTH